jgi:hypothetical protein
MAALRKSNAPPGVRRKATALKGRAHMRGRSLRVWLAGIFVLACSAAGLALVSVGHAGGVVTGANFDLAVQPPALSTSGTGFAKGVFTAASGSGTGSATHVTITFHVDAALSNPSGTSSDCSVAPGSGENVVTCNIGTLNAGQTVKRFVTFTAPSTPGVYPITGKVQWDNGSSGAGGGGGISSLPSKTASTTVYAATNSSHAGNCFLSGSGTVSTPPVSSKDNQATSARVGAAAPSLGLPCPFAEVGEDQGSPGLGLRGDTAISHDTIPPLTQPAQITLTLNSLPVKFDDFSWLFSPVYPATQTYQNIPDCDNGQLPKDAIVCLLSKTKIGNGGSWTFLQLGTGGDPSFGH